MALSDNRLTTQAISLGLPSGINNFPVGNGEKIYQGALVCHKANSTDGYVVKGQTATGLVTVGISQCEVDNTSGAAGDKRLDVKTGAFWVNNSGGDPLAKSEIGALCYVEDDQTVCKTSSGKSVAGTVVAVDSAKGVCVNIQPFARL